MTCESIDMIILLLELLILTFEYRKVHMEFWGEPLVLYCTICNSFANVTGIISLKTENLIQM